MKNLRIAFKCDANVLITGPTGSGKTSLARQIHEEGSRKDKPFVVINLASLHEGTLESELFGHERGAFTGADQKRIGKLERANGGTVFLDEVGELPLRLQARLLEFLQSRVISPLGGSREMKLDVRVIAATHRDLCQAVERGNFREDLLHRLRVISLELKPLRERGDEFDGIVHETLREFCAKFGRNLLRLSPEVALLLETYAWPGNIRELRNVLEYAVLASESEELKIEDFPEWFLNEGEKQEGLSASSGRIASFLSFHEAVDGFERQYLERALSKNGWRISQTARKIGLNKATLIRRMRNHHLRAPGEPALT